MDSDKYLNLKVMRLRCGQLPVVVGAAPASELCRLSFADVLRETDDQGYQRPIDARHSREFRAYIEQQGATTIPLTFNLRGRAGEGWRLGKCEEGQATELAIRVPSLNSPAVLAQVDCQHRLGMMTDSAISLTFQCFLGLSPLEEMSVFSVINAKAKGLSPSLLDYHATKLLPDLETIRLELFIAKHLNDDPGSVWHGQVKLGGASTTQGSKRRASLRGLQTATKALLQRRPFEAATELEAGDRYLVVREFWAAVVRVWPVAWAKPRTHLLTKGVGVTALSLLAADIVASALSRQRPLNVETFFDSLAPIADIDWSNKGPFKAFGGRRGATEVYKVLAYRLRSGGLSVVRNVV
jgi:DNA sulfur modification protein DndB